MKTEIAATATAPSAPRDLGDPGASPLKPGAHVPKRAEDQNGRNDQLHETQYEQVVEVELMQHRGLLTWRSGSATSGERVRVVTHSPSEVLHRVVMPTRTLHRDGPAFPLAATVVTHNDGRRNLAGRGQSPILSVAV